MRAMLCLVWVASLVLTGCGGTEPASVSEKSAGAETSPRSQPPTTSPAQKTTTPASSVPTVTASLSNPVADRTPEDGAVLAAANRSTAELNTSADSPEEDEPTRILHEIQQLRLSEVPADLQQARTVRRERNLRIVEMATQVLRLTLGQPDRQALFNQGITQLLESRFQLALAGDSEDIEQLYADVEALNERDPESIAAMEGVYYLAKFAHTKARLQGRENTVWFENFSRWAREFADRFPDQQTRAVQLLFGAGGSCEMNSVMAESADQRTRLMTEARLCYTALAEKWPDSPQGQQAAAILRRLSLPGQKLSQFSGPTLDGGYVSADQFPGRITVVYFWESESEEFRKDLLPLLKQAHAKLSQQVSFVGVNLDEDETVLNQFLEQNEVPGKQIFFASQEQRSWNSPLMRFWGVSRNPSVWLVDKNGVVSAVDVGHATLVEEMRKLF